MSRSAPRAGDGADVDTLRDRLLDALLAADRRGAEAIIDDALFAGEDGIAILDELIAPAMREVGRLWETGEIAVADEHLATAIAHSTLTRVYPRLVTETPRTRGCVLLAGAAEEEHVLGLRMIADVLEGAGYDVRNVGGALPPTALAAAVRRHAPQLVGLADTMGGAASLRRSIEAVRTVDPSVPVLLGGPGAAEAVDVDEHCEVCDSARATLEAARRLVVSAPEDDVG